MATVRYAFDPAKDAVNQAKHGVSLVLAEAPFAGPHTSMSDDRFDYGEARQVAFGRINDRLFACVCRSQRRAADHFVRQGEPT